MAPTENALLTLLYAVGSLAARESTIDEFANNLGHQVRLHLDGCDLWLVLVDQDGRLLVAGAEDGQEGLSARQWPARSHLLQKVVVEGCVRQIDDVSDRVCPAAFDAGVRSLLVAPLKIGERVVGSRPVQG